MTLDSDGSGNRADKLFPEVGNGHVGMDRTSASASSSADHSPKWMRVAFSLDNAPSLVCVRREFSHLAHCALTQAVHTISFEQLQPRDLSSANRPTRVQYFKNVGIVKSLLAYEAGNKNWVIQMLLNRPYILETLTDSFALLWSKLLQHTVQENCEKVAMGSTSRGLVESVRSSHKWLLSDFMLAIVKRDLAADWALEAIAALPEGAMDANTTPNGTPTTALGDSHILDAESDTPYNQLGPEAKGTLSDPVKGVAGSTIATDLAALTVVILKGLIAIRSNDHIQQRLLKSSVSTRVQCSSSSASPKMPLYVSLVSLLERLLPRSKHHTRRMRTSASHSTHSTYSETHTEAAALHALLSADPLYSNIATAVDMIEGNAALSAAWRRDFVAVTLGFAGRHLRHREEELEILSRVASTLPALSLSPSLSLSGSNKGHLCRWLLLKDSFQASLSAASQILIASREVLLADDMKNILEGVQDESSNAAGVGKLTGDDRDWRGEGYKGLHSAVPSQPLMDNSRILPAFMDLCVKRLWTGLIRAQVQEGKDGGQSVQVDFIPWMQCVLDLQLVDDFSAESLLVGASMLCEEDRTLFCVMATVARIIAITGLPPSAFPSLADIVIGTVGPSDLLRITLTLLSDTAKELHTKQAGGKLHCIDACSRGVEAVLSHASTECLEWLLGAPVIVSASHSVDRLLQGLLGMPSPQTRSPPSSSSSAAAVDEEEEEEDPLQLQSVFESLTLNARCRFLGLLVATDKGTEQRLNALLWDSPLSTGPTGIYIPDMVTTAAACSLVQNLLESLSAPIDLHQDQHLHVRHAHSHAVAYATIFRTAYTSSVADFRSADITVLADECHRGGNTVGCFAKIVRSARIVHLMNCIARVVSIQGVARLLSPSPGLDKALTAAASAIATAPRLWATYLLSQLGNSSVVATVVQSQELLQRLGLLWLHQVRHTDVDRMLPAECTARQKAREMLADVLTATSYTSALIEFESQQLELKSVACIATNILSQSQGEGASEAEKSQLKAAEFVRMLGSAEMSKDLAMNAHIPTILSLYSFLRHRLAFQLTDISVARTLLVTDAIDMLPEDDRLVGRKLFSDFLGAWEILRSYFGTYDVCGRELGAARAIPALTDMTAFVSMLVEVEDTEVHESLPAMMLETRLIKLTNRVLRHDALVTFAADVALNRHGHLSKEIRSEGVSCLSQHAPQRLFLTGPHGASGGAQHFDAVMACYSTWLPDSARPVMPTPLNSATLDAETALLDLKEAMARECQQNAHEWGMILCPGCSNVFERASGCEHLTCGNTSAPYAGTAEPHLAALGTCGMLLNADTHRVPAPVVGQRPLQKFLDEANCQHINASLLDKDAPPIPQFPKPSGRYEIDWISIAMHLYSRVVRGRLDLSVDEGYFSPLPYAVGEEDAVESVLASACAVTVRDNGLGEGRHTIMRGIGVGVGDTYTRLRLAADMVTESLAEIVMNRNKIDSPVTEKAAATVNSTCIMFSVDNVLPRSAMTRIQNFAGRQEERTLEGMCDQALSLCLGTLSLIAEGEGEGEGYFHDLGAVSRAADLPLKYGLPSLLSKIPLPPGAECWSSLLVSILSDFRLPQLFTAIKCIAIIGTDGVACGHSALSAELPEEDKARLLSLQSKLIDEVKEGKGDVASMTDDLQTISSLLTGAMDSMLNDNGNKLLTASTVISKYLREHPHTLGATILSRLKVKHYGQTVHLLRQTLGLIAYHNLQAAQLSYDQKGKSNRQGKGDVPSDAVTVTAVTALTYRELVPLDWEDLQDASQAELNPELCFTAPSLSLSNHYHHSLINRELPLNSEYGEADQEWNIAEGHFAAEKDVEAETGIISAVENEATSDIDMEIEIEDRYVIATPQVDERKPISLAVGESVLPDLSAAWAILMNPTYSTNPRELQRVVEDVLGIFEMDHLQYCTEEEVRQLATLLKYVPSRRLLKAWKLLQ